MPRYDPLTVSSLPGTTLSFVPFAIAPNHSDIKIAVLDYPGVIIEEKNLWNSKEWNLLMPSYTFLNQLIFSLLVPRSNLSLLGLKQLRYYY